ncbi:Hypothetical predicted protein [Paramuricea clavata]|uniref:Uncharacterized protein n=1 Tax=Paramuricea clavata TaxID=317549 RepID=A0A6S7HH34_PARCT|nr:Hypothetical predicted protein [Paramuricea clavata]
MACIKSSTCICVIFLAVLSQVESGACKHGYSCDSPAYCCQKVNVCRYNCIGEPCTSSSHCGPGEYCCNDTCALNCSSCSVNHHCLSGEYCCDRGQSLSGKCARSCIGKSCKYDSHCGSDESCCSNGTCASSCIGEPCKYDSDCVSSEYYRNVYRGHGECANSSLRIQCNSDNDCNTTGKCCYKNDSYKECKDCESESTVPVGWLVVVGILLIPTGIIVFFMCAIAACGWCCDWCHQRMREVLPRRATFRFGQQRRSLSEPPLTSLRTATFESRETQVATSLESHDEEEEEQQQEQQHTPQEQPLNVQNLEPYPQRTPITIPHFVPTSIPQ